MHHRDESLALTPMLPGWCLDQQPQHHRDLILNSLAPSQPCQDVRVIRMPLQTCETQLSARGHPTTLALFCSKDEPGAEVGL